MKKGQPGVPGSQVQFYISSYKDAGDLPCCKRTVRMNKTQVAPLVTCPLPLIPSISMNVGQQPQLNTEH